MIIFYVTFSIVFNVLFSQIQVQVITDLLDKPVYATSIMLDAEIIFVVEQDGVIRIINNSKLEETPFLDITDRVQSPFYPADERGLLGFALDPNFKQNGFFYVNYVDQRNTSIVSRFSSKNLIADSASENYIIQLEQPYSNHNGGHLAFGPDDYLYISFGDGGSAGDPEGRGQDLHSLLGKILRIKVDDKLYDIPLDNPFYNIENAKAEIWHYGLRNAWRFSFDMANGDMYIGDVGQWDWEEINYQSSNSKGGLNFGWNIFEGKHCYKDHELCQSKDTVFPIFTYPHDANYIKTLIGWTQKDMNGCSVTGGYVYRGDAIPEMYGRYIFGDYCTGKVWSFINNKGKIRDIKDHTLEILEPIKKESFYLSSFGQAYNGELFLIDYNGSLYKILRSNEQ